MSLRERLAVRVSGVVQGVGFRPYVHGLATGLSLGGFVRNQNDGVLIEVEGPPDVLRRFVEELPRRAPPAASIAVLRCEARPPLGEPVFSIEASGGDVEPDVFLPPDLATCDACRAELFDPADRRHLYPFLNCTRCGPRLTIVRSAPYDRERTTMASFAMCRACRAEYEDPGDRRFHAQPTACAACGPRLDGDLGSFAEQLRRGRLGALKGLGGYHLVCDARLEEAVRELRRRKARDEKPFAVMVASIAEAERLCAVDGTERELLESPRRPIVLLRRRGGEGVAPSVAPGHPFLGLLLPYTPLHELLAREAGGPLVMTSGNVSDEPIAYRDDDARARLAGIADVFLAHDRPIEIRCEDSVTRVVDGVELPLRRSRGDAPRPLRLPRDCRRPILAVGAQLKSVFALGRGRHAFLSQHLGDLHHADALRAFEEGVAHFERLFAVRPERIAHDLHPDYASTRYARERGLPLLPVQHHHAHLAACLAENGVEGPVIGVIFDGSGLGDDGTLWGGEFLVGDCRQARRAAHLRAVPLPGGERAIREPWRMALAHLVDAGVPTSALEARVDPTAFRAVRTMIERGLNSPLTSSAGRLWDAVAAIAGRRDRVSYEAQAAMELEWISTPEAEDVAYPFEIAGDEVDTRPLIRAAAADVEGPGRVGRRFHSTMVEIVSAVCGRLRRAGAPSAAALSGGVFQNALLLAEASRRLTSEGFRVYRHRQVPPNDGGICLGQLAVAAAQDEE